MRNQAIILNRDLLFGSRLRNVLTAQGLHARFVGTTEAFVEALQEHGGECAIAVIDMNGVVEVDWETVGSALGAVSEAPPVLGFGPHVDVKNRQAAKRAGLTRIVSNGQFSQEMAVLIERYRRT